MGLHKDLNKLTSTLRKTSYPTKTVEMVIKNYLTNAKTKDPTSSQPEPSKQYSKLPYIGPFSKIANNRIRYLVKIYWKDLDVELIFSSFKVGNLLSKTLSQTNSAYLLFINFLVRAVVHVMAVKPPDISQHVCVNICQRTESLMFTNIYRIQINVETSAQRKISLSCTLHPLSFN